MKFLPLAAAGVLLAVTSGCGDDTAVTGAGGQGGGAAASTPSSNDASGATTTADSVSSSTGEGGGATTGPGAGGSGGSTGTGGEAAAVWTPTPGTSWQWQLDEPPLDTSFDVAMYDVDLFDNDAGAIAGLQAEGRVVVCYFNAGTWEPWRPDAGEFPEEVKGEPFDDPKFSEELYLDIRAPEVATIMRSRLDLAAEKGCDAVEPDVVNLHEEGEDITGFPIEPADQLAYNRMIADEAHARGLSVGLKNDLSQLEELEPWFDWALNESCAVYEECDGYATFVDAGKAVFHCEYTEDVAEEDLAAVCAVTTPLGLSTILKDVGLGPYRLACDEL